MFLFCNNYTILSGLDLEIIVLCSGFTDNKRESLMNRIFNRCIITTILLIICDFKMANAQQVPDELFDDVIPALEDSVPPENNEEQLWQSSFPSPEPERHTLSLGLETRPVNSQQMALMEMMSAKADGVFINGQFVLLKNPQRVMDFYQAAQYTTIWTFENQLLNEVEPLQQALIESEQDGLNPHRYHLDIIRVLRPQAYYHDIISLEVLMTDAYLALAGDLTNGIVDPKTIDKEWNAEPVSDEQLMEWLAAGIRNHDIFTPLHQINADNRRYQTLKERYNALRAQGTKATDGLIINMERLRWMPQDWGEQYVITNIPAFNVEMYRDERKIYETRAVVGRADRATPRFINKIQHVVINPTWTVPPTIMRQDKLPKLKNNPAAFDASYEAVSASGKIAKPSSVSWSEGNGYSLRQKSGQYNALGRVKFLFPNKHAIYMHDTPTRHLFKQNNRARSSGCIRLQKPLELAEILLADNGWNAQKIQASIAKEKQQWVNPVKETPVYLVYWTTYVDANNTIKTTPDVYGLDKKLIRAYKKSIVQ